MIVADVIKVYIKKPLDGYFVLGQSALDEGLLGDGTDYENIAVQAEALSLSLDYGNDFITAFNSSPRAGTAVITFESETLDPSVTTWVRPRAEIWVEASSTKLYKGVITDIGVTYTRNDKPIVTIQVADVVAILANKVTTLDLPAENAFTRLGRFSGDGVTITKRGSYDLVNLLGLAAGYSYLDIINMALQSEGGLGAVDNNGVLKCYGQDYLTDTAVAATFTDIPADINHAANVLSYTNIQAGYSTKALCNVLSINNIDVLAGAEVSTEYGPFTNNTSAEVWGPTKVDLTMNYAGGFGTSQRSGTLDAIGAAIVAQDSNTTPQVRISSVEYDVDVNDSAHLTIAKTLTTFSKVDVKYHTETNAIEATHIIIGVRHDISPTRWRVTYDLMQLEELI